MFDYPIGPWFMAGSHPRLYKFEPDPSTLLDGEPSTRIWSINAMEGRGFGTLMRNIPEVGFEGIRLRLSARVRSQDVQGWAGLWMRIDGRRTVLTFDNMYARSIRGSTPWHPYAVVLDVPFGARCVSFGILLSGQGTLWCGDFQLNAADDDEPTTGDSSCNHPSEPFDWENREDEDHWR